MMPIYGVYLIPEPQHPLYQLGSAFLGYDIWRQTYSTPLLADVVGEAQIRQWIGNAKSFSIHATIADCLAYRAEDVDEIHKRMIWIADRTAPFTLINGRFFTEFHATPTAFTLTFDSPDGALQQLHRLVVTLISVLHESSPYFGSWEDRLNAPMRRNLIRYGAPSVLEHFWPHWSLATSVPDQKVWDRLRAETIGHTGIFSGEETRTLPVNAVQLVELQENGFYKVAASFDLRG
jgi:hypothetical protein